VALEKEENPPSSHGSAPGRAAEIDGVGARHRAADRANDSADQRAGPGVTASDGTDRRACAGAKQATGDSAIPGALAACDDDKTEGGQRDWREYKWRHVLAFLHGAAFAAGLGWWFSETRSLVVIAKTRCQSVMRHGAGIEAMDMVGMTMGAVSDVNERNDGPQQVLIRGWLEM
jgi:hypothetical protein